MSTGQYSQRFDEAAVLAVSSFRFKVRKGTGIPYITHLFAVCALVGEHGGSEDQLIAALLHDYLEDIEGASVDDLRERFGPQVAAWVEALSDAVTQPKPPWQARKEAFLARICVQPAEVKLICAADKLHNCRSIIRDRLSIGEAIFDRFTGKKDGTLWYYRSLVPALGSDWSHAILDELDKDVRRLCEISKG